jgi:hypothetical protein
MEVQRVSSRLPVGTSDPINRRVYRQMLCRLEYYARHPEEINQRLRELDQEWDVDRALQANAAGIGLLGLLLAPLRGARYFLLPLMAFGFLLQHAYRGTCAPAALLRRLELRTREEIAVERQALKILRGDFEDARQGAGPERALAAASR